VRADPPIVIRAARGTDDDGNALAVTGVRGIERKPLTIRELCAAVRRRSTVTRPSARGGEAMAEILIVDDDRAVCETIATVAVQQGHAATIALTAEDGVRQAQASSFDLVFLDVRLPDGSGLDVLPRIRGAASAPEVVMMTGFGDPDGAERAINDGAWDYLLKPSSFKEIRLALSRSLQYREEKRSRQRPVSLDRAGIVGEGPAIRECLDQVARAAVSDVSVLVSGETGTGKELFAWAVHNNSARARKSFVVVDCTALPRDLVESVLFGHERGAFTGADRAHNGLIEQADGGTLFLDEVGELPLEIQKKFLRVLEEHRFRRVGGEREHASDFRLVAATNRDLQAMVDRGEFRGDLLFRLRGVTIELPPLRERREDVKELARFHVARQCEKRGIESKALPVELVEALESYDWPGNVRELFHSLEKALASAGPDPVLFAKDLPTTIRAAVARKSVSPESDLDVTPEVPLDFGRAVPTLKQVRDEAVADIERRYLRRLIAHVGGDVERARSLAGLSRSRIYALLKKHGIPT